ncbi:MAG: hypothetical protein ACI9U2_001917 [Bradymonadia bacterium]|jgi:hypothetical protein
MSKRPRSWRVSDTSGPGETPGPRIPAGVLDAIDLDALRLAAHHEPTHAAALTALADILEQGAPIATLWDRIGAPDQLIDRLKPAMVQAQASLGVVRHQLQTARRRLRQGAQHRQKMQDALAKLAVNIGDTPELLSRLKTVGALLADDDPWMAAKATLDSTVPLIDALEASLCDPVPGATQGKWAEHQAALEHAHARLADIPARLNEARAVVAEAAAIAEEMQHPLSARLWALTAQMAEALDPETADAAWRSALDRALIQADLPLIQLAGRRVQARAIARGDTRTVALVAHRTAQAAAQLGATDVEVIARLLQAQAAAHEAAHHQSARRIATDAVVGAEHLGDPALLSRARLMCAQLLDQIGDGAEARSMLRALMRDSKAAPIPQALLGRAALVLGKSEHGHQHRGRARQNLTLALQIAQQTDDAGLYERALPALLALLEEAAPDAAAATYRDAQAYLAGTPQGAALDAALIERFGQTAWMG